jgi:Stf0 sulphotransferase
MPTWHNPGLANRASGIRSRDTIVGGARMTDQRRSSLGRALWSAPRLFLGESAADQVRQALGRAKTNARLLKYYVDGLTPAAGTKPFIVFGLMRSGTTFFGDLLGQHPDVTWLGESFVGEAYCPILYLQGAARRIATPCTGIKIFPFQLSRRTDLPTKGYGRSDIDRARRTLDVMGTKNFKFIHLEREDIFSQSVSLTRAAQTGVWYMPAGGETAYNGRVRLDLGKFGQYLNELLIFRRYERDVFSEIEMLRFTYEKDLQDTAAHQESARKAFRFLGLALVSVSSRFAKMGTSPLDRQIENYDEVVDMARCFGVPAGPISQGCYPQELPARKAAR